MLILILHGSERWLILDEQDLKKNIQTILGTGSLYASSKSYKRNLTEQMSKNIYNILKFVYLL